MFYLNRCDTSCCNKAQKRLVFRCGLSLERGDDCWMKSARNGGVDTTFRSKLRKQIFPPSTISQNFESCDNLNMQTLYILIFLYQRTAQIMKWLKTRGMVKYYVISSTSQRDHDEFNEIVQHKKRPIGIPFISYTDERPNFKLGFPSRGSPVKRHKFST